MFRYLLGLIVVSHLLLSSAFASELMVGISTTDITPSVSENVPLGGYGSGERRDLLVCLWFPKKCLKAFLPGKGTLDPIRAKAMYLERPGKKLLFIGLDLVGVTSELYNDILNRLASEGFTSAEVIVSATHTHSGPGALSRNYFWEIAAMGRFRKDFHEKVLNQIVDTVKAAKLKAAPAELYKLTFATQGLQHNRRGEDRPLDPNANLLLAKAQTGEWLGGLVNFAMHGTYLGTSNHYFSSDVPGAIEAEMEKMVTELNGIVRLDAQAEFIFVNGAEGDVTAKMNYKDLGIEFAKQAASAWENKESMDGDWEVRQKEIYLGSPKLNLRKCAGSRFPKSWNVSIKKHIASTASVSQIHFDGLSFLTWPGEPTTELGMKLVAAVKEAGASEAWVFGLTNGYLAYFVSHEEFHAGGYEACSSYYGGAGAERIIQNHQMMMSER